MKLTPHIQNILKNSKKDTEWRIEEEERQAVRQESRKAGLVATQLAFYMKTNKISQTKLGKEIGVSPQQISKILKGRENLTIGTIEKIEKALRIDLLLVNNLESEKKIETQKVIQSPGYTSSFNIELFDSVIRQSINLDFIESETRILTKDLENQKLPNDYYEQMKQKAIQRAFNRFEKLKSTRDLYFGGKKDFTSIIVVPLGSEEKKWEKFEDLILNES